MHVIGTITVANTAVANADANNTNRMVIFINFALFTSCMSRINNTQNDTQNDAQYINVVMPMYNLIEYNDNYSKTSAVLFQYCRDVPALDKSGAVTDFTEGNGTDLLNFKEKLTGQTGDNGTKNVETLVPLTYLSNFRQLFKCL